MRERERELELVLFFFQKFSLSLCSSCCSALPQSKPRPPAPFSTLKKKHPSPRLENADRTRPQRSRAPFGPSHGLPQGAARGRAGQRQADVAAQHQVPCSPHGNARRRPRLRPARELIVIAGRSWVSRCVCRVDWAGEGTASASRGGHNRGGSVEINSLMVRDFDKTRKTTLSDDALFHLSLSSNSLTHSPTGTWLRRRPPQVVRTFVLSLSLDEN